MNKSQLKKTSKFKNLKCKEYKQMHFAKNSIILRKNQTSRHVFMLKSGQACIFSQHQPQKVIHVYKQGQCLNSIQVCLSLPSFKTIKATTRCQIFLMIWTKEHQDEHKKHMLIPLIAEMKFYEIPIFKNLAYGLMLELLGHFVKLTMNKLDVRRRLGDMKGITAFLVEGGLLVESVKRKDGQGLRRSESCQRSGLMKDKQMKLVKLEKGQMLYLDQEGKYAYQSQSQKCQIISISTQLLYYFLPVQFTQRIKQLKLTQRTNLQSMQTRSYKALKTMTRSINRQNSRSEIIPIQFHNQVELRKQKFQKARSVHYIKNNRHFRSFSEEKRKILELRDKGYKQISQLNRRKYGRNYIYQKRLQISKNIHGEDCIFDNEAIRKSQSQGSMKRGITVYQSVSMKDDYGILKQSPLMRVLRKFRKKKNFTAHNSTINGAFNAKNDKDIQNLTLKSVEKIRKNFEDNSKTLLKNYQKQEMQNDF